MHVRHDDRFTLLRRHAAHALTQRNANTRGIALEWSKHQFFALQKIEAGPIDVRQRIKEQRTEVCCVGDEIVLTFEQAQQLHDEARIQLLLGCSCWFCGSLAGGSLANCFLRRRSPFFRRFLLCRSRSHLCSNPPLQGGWLLQLISMLECCSSERRCAPAPGHSLPESKSQRSAVEYR